MRWHGGNCEVGRQRLRVRFSGFPTRQIHPLDVSRTPHSFAHLQPVSDWKHFVFRGTSSFTGIFPYIIVRFHRPLRAALRFPPAAWLRSFGWEDFMWRKPEDNKPSSPVAEVPAAPRPEPVRSVAGLTAEVVQPSGGVVTSSLVIKGEIPGREDLYIDGEVQGSIHLVDGRVTVGPHGKISADVDAREIAVRGIVKGSLRGRDRVEVGRTGEIPGDITPLRFAVGEAAEIHRQVESQRPG